MSRFIEINAKNLPIITELNNGVAPQIEEPAKFYVHWEHDALANEIVTAEQVQNVTRLMPPELITIER